MNKVLTKKDVNRAGLRWMVMPMSSFCYEVQFGQAVVYALSPALRKIYPDDDDYLAAINNHFKYFNTQPYMCQIVLGAALGMEEQLGREGADTIQDFKTGVMGPLAGIGDTLFWVVIPTIWASIASPMALEGNATGLILWTIFGIALTLFRLKFFEWGYNLGTRLITELKSTLQVLTDACSILGLTVVGALIPSVVSVTVPLTIHFETGTSMVVQEQLDTIMPCLVPVVLTLICYKLLGKKKVSMTWLVVIVLIISIIGSSLGILG